MGRIWLSHSGIEGLERCPRCFWLQYNKGIYQPEGIVSRLANRFDRVLKNYFNTFRQSGELPPMIDGKIEGKLQNPFQEVYWARIDDKYGFKGKLDECIVLSDGSHIPLDFKTASTDPRPKELLDAYQSQIDAYIFLLKQNGKKVGDYGYLIFFFPDELNGIDAGFPMVIHIKKVKGNPGKTPEKIARAINILEGKMPHASPSCPFCNYRNARHNEGQ